MLGEDLIDERAEGGRQHQGAGAVDDHQQEAAGEQEAARLDERPDLGPDVFELGLGALGGEIGGDGATGAARAGESAARMRGVPPMLDVP